MAESFTLGRRSDLDGVRALAVLGVMVAHAQLAVAGLGLPLIGSGGGIGVNVFFVLSGFLITALLIEERRTHRAVSIRSFYVRRALRLLPALYVMLLAVAVYGVARPHAPFPQAAMRGIPAVVFYYANWVHHQTAQCGGLGFLGHTWSLAVEEQFYLVWPLIFVVVTRRSLNRLWLVIGAGVAVAVALRFVLPLDAGNACRVERGVDSQADALLIGCGAAVALYGTSAPRSTLSRIARVLAWPAALAIAVIALLPIRSTAVFVRVDLLVVNVATGTVIVALVTSETLASRVLSWRPLAAIGIRSYGMYLWHAPLLYAMGAELHHPKVSVLVALAATFPVAWASYAVIERPALRAKARFSRRAHPASGEPAL